MLHYTLGVWLPVTEQRRTSSIRVGQFDRVDADTNASFYFRQYLLGECSITEETVTLLRGQLGELKVLPSCRTVDGQSSCGGKICTNAEALKRAQACVHRQIVLFLGLTRDDLLKLGSLELCGLALDASN